jgi:NADH-quinone oxidoreductase subunit C
MAGITNEYLLQRLKDQFGDSILFHEEQYGMLSVVIDAAKNTDVLKWLYDDAELQFQFMTDLCGIHYPDNKDHELGVIYHLHSFAHNTRFRIKCFVPVDKPVIRSATGVFKGANWQERETYDFYGIIFEGHPNLKRILNVEEMDYFPMRKEYPLEDGTRTDKEDKYFGR